MPRPPESAVPDGLSEKSARLWRAIVPDRARSAGRVALVEQALRALDRADEAAALVASEGLITETKTTGAIHMNPVLRVERESRQLFARIFGMLHLEWSSEVDGRTKSVDDWEEDD